MLGVRRVVLGAVVLVLALSTAVWWFYRGWQFRRDRLLERYLEGRSAYTVASTELTGMVPRTLFESMSLRTEHITVIGGKYNDSIVGDKLISPPRTIGQALLIVLQLTSVELECMK